MFIATGARPSPELRPASSGIAPGDWAILADFWYPVAIADQVSDQPLRAQLLDVALVVYRGRDAELAVAIDMCPHRQVRLSNGKIIEGELECPFHGLRFDTRGQCTRVPALARDMRLPDRYRVRTFPVRQRYGLLWTCLGDAAKHPLPSFPSLEDTALDEFAYTAPILWPVSAPRQVENFCDLAHLPFVHASTLGGDPTAPIAPGQIAQHPDGLTMTARYMETGADGKPALHELTYRIVLPFAVEFRTLDVAQPSHYLESADIPSPVSAHSSRVFQIIKHPQGRAAADGLVQPLTMVNQQDIEILNTLMSPELPLDQHHEIHLPVDNIAGAYRQRLRTLGLGAGAPAESGESAVRASHRE